MTQDITTRDEAAVAVDVWLEAGGDPRMVGLIETPDLCQRVYDGHIDLDEALQRAALADDILAQVADNLAIEHKVELDEANGQRRERLLNATELTCLIEQCIRSRQHCTDRRPLVHGQVADSPVPNAYRYPAYRTVGVVDIDEDGNIEMSISVGSANGNGRISTYVAVTPETEAPWHQAYRV